MASSNQLKVLHYEEHSEKMLAMMYEFYKKGLFCDVALRTKDVKTVTFAHSVVLSAISSFFAEEIYKQAGNPNGVLLDLFNVELKHLKPLIEFCYTGRMHFKDENMEEILKTANALQMLSVIEVYDRALLNQSINYNKPSLEHEVTKATVSETGMVLALGGTLDEKAPIIEIYHTHLNTWIGYKNSPEAIKFMHAYSATLIGQNFIIAGGEENYNKTIVNKVHSLNLPTMKWTAMPNMQTSRNYFGIAALSKKLYAVGGWNYQEAQLSSVESWNAESDKWTYVSAMNTKRKGHGVVVLNGRIYAVGGFNQTEGCLSSIEYYDSARDSWTTKCSMLTKRYLPAVGVYKDQIYVFGGWAGHDELSTAERYDPSKDEWTQIASMSIPRSAFGCALLNNNFLLVGGWSNTNDRMKIVEKYIPDTNEYIKMPQLLYPRYYFHAVTVPNIVPIELKFI